MTVNQDPRSTWGKPPHLKEKWVEEFGDKAREDVVEVGPGIFVQKDEVTDEDLSREANTGDSEPPAVAPGENYQSPSLTEGQKKGNTSSR